MADEALAEYMAAIAKDIREIRDGLRDFANAKSGSRKFRRISLPRK